MPPLRSSPSHHANLENNPSCPLAAEQKSLGWRRNIFISLTEYIRPVSGLGYCRCLRLRWAPGILQTCLMWPLFKHSDHPVKLRLMDRACHSERPRQRGDNLVTRTHLSFVVERDIVCTGALVSAALEQALCELRCSQSCHLGLNNPRCHYLVYLSTPLTHTHTHSDQTIHSQWGWRVLVHMRVCVCVCYILFDVMCLCDCTYTVDCLFHPAVRLMHSCTCPFNGIPPMENNRWAEVLFWTQAIFIFFLRNIVFSPHSSKEYSLVYCIP